MTERQPFIDAVSQDSATLNQLLAFDEAKLDENYVKTLEVLSTGLNNRYHWLFRDYVLQAAIAGIKSKEAEAGYCVPEFFVGYY